MEIHTQILGNLNEPRWKKLAADACIDYVPLDQWTAQKSRLVARSERTGEEVAIALRRNTRLQDGDILAYEPDAKRILAVRILLNDVLVVDLGELVHRDPETIVGIAFELGHAVGNQHWPAVVKKTRVYIPLTVDKKVMDSVMRTHHIEQITFSFQPGSEIIPYLAPHEIRRLFGGTGPDSHTHQHAGHEHAHTH